MARAFRRMGWLWFALSAPSWGAAPLLGSGVYRAGDLGYLQLASDNGRVSAKYLGGGVCPFEADQRVLEGRFEGNVLVGSVLLCQTGGPHCTAKVYPFLGFLGAPDGVLGRVRLDEGCSSPSLSARRLSLSLVDARALRSVSRKKPNARRSVELARQALLNGKRHLEEGDFNGAAQEFELGLTYNEDNWAAYFGLGVAEFRRNNVYKAIDSYERALELARKANYKDPDIHFNLACAHSRLGDRNEALAHLERALELGFAIPDDLERDSDLKKVFLPGDADYARLVAKARANHANVRRPDLPGR